MQTKSEIRKILKEKRLNLNKNKKNIFDEKIYKKIISNSSFKKAEHVLFYISFKNEVDTIKLILNNLYKKNIYVPKVKGNKIDIYKINSLEDLEKGAFSIPEPKADSKKIDPKIIDFALIPGIAFDDSGHRIGFGKGYYDYLNKNLNCLKVGLAYNFQIVDNIPAEKHDIKVDLIITDKQTITI